MSAGWIGLLLVRSDKLENLISRLQQQNLKLAVASLSKNCDHAHMLTLLDHKKSVYEELVSVRGATNFGMKGKKEEVSKRVTEYHKFLQPLPLAHRGELMFSREELEKLFL